MMQIDLYDLKVGDRFMEDTYPEIYKVVRIEEPTGCGMRLVIAQDLETGEESEWGYTTIGEAYAPCIIKL